MLTYPENLDMGPGKRPLKVGLMLPQATGSMQGKTPGWSDIVAMTQLAEAVGFDSLWVADAFFVRFEAGVAQGFWECWSLLAALAAVTTRVQLGSLVSCTNYRHPSLLAKIASTLDDISSARLILGVGAGSDAEEHTSSGFEWQQRYSRFEEALQIMRDLLRGERSNFCGQHFQVYNCELLPRGPRPAGPPLLLGTTTTPGPRMLRLVAQHAQIWNGWLAFESRPLDVLPTLLRSLDAACLCEQRSPSSLLRSVGIGVALQGQRLFDGPRDITEGALKGSPAEIAHHLHWLAQQGIAHVQISLAPNTPAGIEAFAEVLACLDNG